MKTIYRTLALGAVFSFLGALAGAASASAESCQEVCSDARQNCMNARQVAHLECRSGCRETINEAAANARAICEQQELGERACRAFVWRTVAAAQDACRADCRIDAKQAGVVCKDERSDCAEVCSGQIDPVCRDACVDGFYGCRQELVGCVDACRDDRRAAVEACRQDVGETCDPKALRECVRQARAEYRTCHRECRADTTCARDLRECLGDCLEGPGVVPGEN